MTTQPTLTNRSVFFLIGMSALSVTALIIGPVTPEPVHGSAAPRSATVERGEYHVNASLRSIPPIRNQAPTPIGPEGEVSFE